MSDTITISDKSPLAGDLRSVFEEYIPQKPYCTDDLTFGLKIRNREAALQHRFIQLNGPSTFRWLPFDIDEPCAWLAAEEANLPPPNVVMVNRANGHAHMAYLLQTPVGKHSMARERPQKYFRAIERGFTKRLNADKYYAGVVIKNPVHESWEVQWRRNTPYSLDELNDWLFEGDKQPDRVLGEGWGAGRNCTTFDELREFAYREVLSFKAARADLGAFSDRLERVALGINQQFITPLPTREVRAIVKSVAGWTWRHFSPQQFSAIQSYRGKVGMARRWAGHRAESKTRPWETLGISRRTYYRRKRAQLTKADA